MILNNFQKIKIFENFSQFFSGGGSPRGKKIFFDFSPFQAILSRFWFLKFFSVINEKNEKKFFEFFSRFRWFWTTFKKFSKKFLKIFLSFFRGGVTKGQKFFFRFLAVSGHSESILIFSDFLQNWSDRGGRGGGGAKILACDFTKIDAFWVCSGMAVLNSALLKTLPIPCPRVMVPRVGFRRKWG